MFDNITQFFSNVPLATAVIKSAPDNIMNACKVQANWMKNAAYKWESNPTIAKSKKKGTCVTYVACVLQRLGYLASGKYLWQNGKGYGTGKVTGTNDKMVTIYMDNKPLKSLKKALQKGDVVFVDDNKSGEAGNGGHVFIVTGGWSGDQPYIWDNYTAAAKPKARLYGANRKVLAVVRMKDAIAGKSIDTIAHEVINGAWGSGDNRKKALTEAHYDYAAVQKRVDEILNPPAPTPTPTPTPTPSGQGYTGAYPNPKKYLEYGDKGAEVKKLQRYLNWFFYPVFGKNMLKVDGIYGKDTLKGAKQMQLVLGIPEAQCDGKVGPKTIALMKAYRR